MDSMILFGLRIALLAVLWFFVFLCLRSLRKSTRGTVAPTHTPSSGGGAVRTLTIADGPYAGSTLEIITLSEVTIGRAKDCTFVVVDDYASSRHAKLMKHGSGWVLEDLDSRNGTFVNGVRIDAPEKVSTASEITIGRTTLRLVS